MFHCSWIDYVTEYEDRLVLRIYDASQKKEFLMYGQDQNETMEWFEQVERLVERINKMSPLVVDLTNIKRKGTSNN